MKGARVGAAIAEHQAACPVGVGQRKVRVLHQLQHLRQDVAAPVGRAGLQGKPFVQHQRFVLEQRMKACQRGCRQCVATADQRAERVGAVGHVAGVLETLQGLAWPDGVAGVLRCQTQHGQ